MSLTQKSGKRGRYAKVSKKVCSFGGETASTGIKKLRLHTERLSARKKDGK